MRKTKSKNKNKNNKTKNKNKKKNYKTKNKNKKGGTLEILAAEKLLDMGYSPNDFEELGYPEQIVNSVKRVKIAKTFKKKIDDKIKKRKILKKRFKDYYENYVNYLQLSTDLRIPEISIKIFNPLDYQVAYLTKMAYNVPGFKHISLPKHE